ncbi:MAG: DUF4296 domain-containing protein [Bacteroidaceae bacterium]|nr:DUF4296 domain-containing protein [Bacteroidaceae bacterium]
MRRIDILALALLSVVLSGCRLKRPDNVLSPKKMEQFLYDYHLAQAIGQELPREEKYMTQAYVDWAYSKNGITKEEFNTSLVWYTRYPKELTKIYKHLSNRVNAEYKAASRSLSQIEKKAFAIQSGDSVNLWYLDRTALLNTSAYMNKLTYRINRDTTFHKGDTIRLNLTGTFVSIDSGVPAYAYMSLSAYYSDSTSTADTVLCGNGDVRLSVILDSKRDMLNISGSINYLDSTDNRSSMLVLSGMELMRYHETAAPDTVKVLPEVLSPAEL